MTTALSSDGSNRPRAVVRGVKGRGQRRSGLLAFLQLLTLILFSVVSIDAVARPPASVAPVDLGDSAASVLHVLLITQPLQRWTPTATTAPDLGSATIEVDPNDDDIHHERNGSQCESTHHSSVDALLAPRRGGVFAPQVVFGVDPSHLASKPGSPRGPPV